MRDYHCQLSQLAPDWTTESDRCEDSAIGANCILFRQQVHQSWSIANQQIRTCTHTMAYEEGF